MKCKVGIDVSKHELEPCAMSSPDEKDPARQRFENSADGHRRLVQWAMKVSGGRDLHFCMEPTGGYELDLACHLSRAGLLVSVENPRRIKAFSQALGQANKTDRADARVIALYALAMDPRPWHLSEDHRRELAQLGRHREDLQVELTRLRNRLERKENLPGLVRSQLEELVGRLEEHIEEVGTAQLELSDGCQGLRNEIAALMQLPGVGFTTAAVLVSEMPDVRGYDDAQTWCAQAGMFPCRRESGLYRGPSRMSKAGNAHVRRILYMGATHAMRSHPAIRALAARLKEKGRKPKQIRVACMRKLLMTCFGVLKALADGRRPFYGERPRIPDTT